MAKETSPYLQQHKKNPVNWWPYSQEAFELAKKEDKPLFISIGYSSCHWCHVMARESFSDNETAEYMNKYFINIKIDREEYPGVDKAYQEMYQLLNRRGGGWPLSVWAHSDGSSFFIGTYYPKKNSYGMHSFMEVNKRIVDAWVNERDLLDQQATNLVRGLRSLGEYKYQLSNDITDKIYQNEVIGLRKLFDYQHGGIGGAPKFPRISSLRFLIQEGYQKNHHELIDFVQFTFTKMAKGGIYDQLGGGFARYSVDKKWLIPHFEKMLYDNAGMVHLGAELYAVTKDPFIAWIVKDVINWLIREMRSSVGGFCSALNAESIDQNSIEREGAYYVWTQKEMKEILKENYKIAELRFNITKKGNFTDPHHPEVKGMNILSIGKNIQELSSILGIDGNEVLFRINKIRELLFQVRMKRIAPSKDTKIITSWNCMLIKSLFIAAELLNYPQASKFAKGCLDFVLENLIDEKKVIRSYHETSEGFIERKIDGILDDYSFLISALIQAFEYTDKWDYILIAKKILSFTDEKFYDETSGIYFLNPINEDSLINRIVQASDDSMASGLAIMVSNLFKLGKYLENNDLVDRGLSMAKKFAGKINEFPGAMNELLNSTSYYLRYPSEIVIVKDNENKLNNSHYINYLPQRLVYRWNANNMNDGRPKWGILEGRMDVDVPTAYICKGNTCSLPVSSGDEIIAELTKKI